MITDNPTGIWGRPNYFQNNAALNTTPIGSYGVRDFGGLDSVDSNSKFIKFGQLSPQLGMANRTPLPGPGRFSWDTSHRTWAPEKPQLTNLFGWGSGLRFSPSE